MGKKGFLHRLEQDDEQDTNKTTGAKRIIKYDVPVIPEKKCNVRESGIDDTTPVGLFSPDGDSPSGCADMIGNVWEWTSTSVGEDNFLAMGTGWDHYVRQTEIPLDRVYRNHSVGFRVVRYLMPGSGR